MSRHDWFYESFPQLKERALSADATKEDLENLIGEVLLDPSLEKKEDNKKVDVFDYDWLDENDD